MVKLLTNQFLGSVRLDNIQQMFVEDLQNRVSNQFELLGFLYQNLLLMQQRVKRCKLQIGVNLNTKSSKYFDSETMIYMMIYYVFDNTLPLIYMYV